MNYKDIIEKANEEKESVYTIIKNLIKYEKVQLEGSLDCCENCKHCAKFQFSDKIKRMQCVIIGINKDDKTANVETDCVCSKFIRYKYKGFFND